MSIASSSSGTLYAVGVGPGDPELLTVKATRLIAAAEVIAYHSGTKGTSIARSIVADLIPDGIQEELLAYPVTVGPVEHAGGYYGEIAEFYDDSAARLATHLAAGRTVVVLAEGDPLFYSSYMYLHDRLSMRFRCEIVPGVTSVSASSAAVGVPLVRHEDVLTVLPGTLPVPELARRLADTDAAVIMKLGRTFEGYERRCGRPAAWTPRCTWSERAPAGRASGRSSRSMRTPSRTSPRSSCRGVIGARTVAGGPRAPIHPPTRARPLTPSCWCWVSAQGPTAGSPRR